eukprot:1106766-Alexandrium_andersonii.AAC.1
MAAEHPRERAICQRRGGPGVAAGPVPRGHLSGSVLRPRRGCLRRPRAPPPVTAARPPWATGLFHRV